VVHGAGRGTEHEQPSPQNFLFWHARQRTTQGCAETLDGARLVVGNEAMQQLLRTGPGTIQQRDEYLVASMVQGGILQQGQEEGFYDLAGLDRVSIGLRLKLLKQREPLAV